MKCSPTVVLSSAMKSSRLNFLALFLVLAVFAGNALADIPPPVVYFTDNFENWTVHGGSWSSVTNENANNTINTSTDFAMTGSKSLKCTDNDPVAPTEAHLVKTLSPGISGNIYVGFYIYLPSAYLAANPVGSADRRLLRVTTGLTSPCTRLSCSQRRRISGNLRFHHW